MPPLFFLKILEKRYESPFPASYLQRAVKRPPDKLIQGAFYKIYER